MINAIDTSGFDADDFLRVPNCPNDPDSIMLRDFVQEAINEGLILPLAIDPLGVLILLMDPMSDLGMGSCGGCD